MASSEQQDWSDSDEDDLSQVETSVLLGIPDGAIESPSDLTDAAVSRIGGLPVRLVPTQACITLLLNKYHLHSQALLSPRVPPDSSHCRHCKNPMELLVQLWAPLQNSPYDRAVYVWGCANSGCQRMPGRYVAIQNKLTVMKRLCFGTALGRGAACVTTKIMLQSLSASSQGNSRMEQRSQNSTRILLRIKMSTHLLCVRRNLP